MRPGRALLVVASVCVALHVAPWASCGSQTLGLRGRDVTEGTVARLDFMSPTVYMDLKQVRSWKSMLNLAAEAVKANGPSLTAMGSVPVVGAILYNLLVRPPSWPQPELVPQPCILPAATSGGAALMTSGGAALMEGEWWHIPAALVGAFALGLIASFFCRKAELATESGDASTVFQVSPALEAVLLLHLGKEPVNLLTTPEMAEVPTPLRTGTQSSPNPARTPLRSPSPPKRSSAPTKLPSFPNPLRSPSPPKRSSAPTKLPSFPTGTQSSPNPATNPLRSQSSAPTKLPSFPTGTQSRPDPATNPLRSQSSAPTKLPSFPTGTQSSPNPARNPLRSPSPPKRSSAPTKRPSFPNPLRSPSPPKRSSAPTKLPSFPYPFSAFALPACSEQASAATGASRSTAAEEAEAEEQPPPSPIFTDSDSSETDPSGIVEDLRQPIRRSFPLSREEKHLRLYQVLDRERVVAESMTRQMRRSLRASPASLTRSDAEPEDV